MTVLDPEEVIRSMLARLLAEAEAVGVIVPHGMEPAEVVVFYRDGRPVEARVSGNLDGATWATAPAPRWAKGGGLLPEDDEKPHAYARANGSWGNRTVTRAAHSAFSMLEDLAEAHVDLPEALQSVVRLVLERLAVSGGEPLAAWTLTETGAALRARLAADMKKRLRELRRATGMEEWPPPTDESAVTRAAAGWMAKAFSVDGADSAQDLLRHAEANPWAPWFPEGDESFPFLLRRLVRLLWRNGLEAEAERARAKRPALVRGIYVGELVAMQTSQLPLPGIEERELRDRRGRIVATIDASAADLTVVHHGLAILRSPVGHRLVKNLVLTTHRQAEVGEVLFNRVQYDGGWSGVAEALSYSRQDFSELKALAKMGQHVNWQSRDGIQQGGGWWLVYDKRGGPGAPGFVRFTLADCFLPGFATDLARNGGNSFSARLARRLVPELPFEPPTGGVNERSHGAVWNLHRLFLAELVDRAEELAKHGLVVVKPEEWQTMAQTAGLPANLLGRVLKAWTEGENETAPKMVERDGDQWRLALDTYRPEHDFIVDNGHRQTSGRIRGRKQADKRKGRGKE